VSSCARETARPKRSFFPTRPRTAPCSPGQPDGAAGAGAARSRAIRDLLDLMADPPAPGRARRRHGEIEVPAAASSVLRHAFRQQAGHIILK
jgi:hypothetical protein